VFSVFPGELNGQVGDCLKSPPASIPPCISLKGDTHIQTMSMKYERESSKNDSNPNVAAAAR